MSNERHEGAYSSFEQAQDLATLVELLRGGEPFQLTPQINTKTETLSFQRLKDAFDFEMSQIITESALDDSANEAATSPLNDLPEPSQAQYESGNYKKGHIRFQGLDIAIENPRGSTRSGVDPSGQKWSITMTDHYGYIKRTEGADGDHVDIYIGPDEQSPAVYVVDQIDQGTELFDEHKVMLGYPSRSAAIDAYKANFTPGWKVGPVSMATIETFKDWLKTGNCHLPFADAMRFNNLVASEKRSRLEVLRKAVQDGGF
ncbi:MAG: hypothetical protein OIF57_17505 [Marinobacterium sp.]|nr:hypothetical protein [Marinobacterium sp.]